VLSDLPAQSHHFGLSVQIWVLFNFKRIGFPHIYAASVPEGLVDEFTAA